jgi:hypothetical protein
MVLANPDHMCDCIFDENPAKNPYIDGDTWFWPALAVTFTTNMSKGTRAPCAVQSEGVP